MDFWDYLMNLTKEELVDLIAEYDSYIQNANDEDRFHEGWRPVCIAEFYGAEYRMILEDREAMENGDGR